MKNSFKSVIILSGYLSGILILVVQTWIMIRAYFNDSKSVTIYVNRFGEQFGDVIVFIFIWIICLFGLYLLYNKIKKQNISE